MSDIIISSDSTCDLSKDLLDKYQIAIMPLSVMLGTESFKDGVDIVPQNIFDYFDKTGNLPKTAAPSVSEYQEFFKQFVEQGKTVVHINISSKASGSYGFAAAAAKEFEGKVYVVDSHALSTGQGLLVMKACDLREQGKNGEEICNTLLSLRGKVNTSFIPDTLLYLYKGGRCSTLSYYGSKVLSIHPMIDMKDGQLYPKKKYIGKMSRCLKNYINDLVEEYPLYDKTRCFITHSSADQELVDQAKSAVKELFHFDEIIETVAGSIITSHCGKNTIGVLFISE
mgnify:CR=1 FL=1